MTKMTKETALRYLGATYQTPYGKGTIFGLYPTIDQWDFKIQDSDDIQNISIGDVRPILYRVSSMSARQREELHTATGFELTSEGFDVSIKESENCREVKEKAEEWLRGRSIDMDGLIESGAALDAQLENGTSTRRITSLFEDAEKQRDLFGMVASISEENFRMVQKSGWVSAVDRIASLLDTDNAKKIKGVLLRVKSEYDFLFAVEHLKDKAA